MAWFRVTSSRKAQVLSWTAPTGVPLTYGTPPVSLDLEPSSPGTTTVPASNQGPEAWTVPHCCVLERTARVLSESNFFCVVKLKHVAYSWHDFRGSRFNTEQARNLPKCVILLVFLILCECGVHVCVCVSVIHMRVHVWKSGEGSVRLSHA